jgi:hypothetical protein
MQDLNCAGCVFSVFYVNSHEEPVSECRRYPPTLLVDLKGDIMEFFPDATRRCGEYKEESPEGGE